MSGPWTPDEIEKLKDAYERAKRDRRKIDRHYHKVDFGDLLKNRTRDACRDKARRLGLVMPPHNCWKMSRVIKKEYVYAKIKPGMKKSQILGLWRYRECAVCGAGFQTYETKHREYRNKNSKNRIIPLPSWNKEP